VHDRTCQRRKFDVLLDGPSDQLVLRHRPVCLVTPFVEKGEEIRRPVETTDRLDARELIEPVAEIPFEFSDAAGGSEQGDEVTSRRGAPRAEPVGVDPKTLRVAAEESNGGLDVVDLRREESLLAQPVVDGGDGVPFAERFRRVRRRLVAGAPRAAVDPEDQRNRVVGSFGLVGRYRSRRSEAPSTVAYSMSERTLCARSGVKTVHRASRAIRAIERALSAVTILLLRSPFSGLERFYPSPGATFGGRWTAKEQTSSPERTVSRISTSTGCRRISS